MKWKPDTNGDMVIIPGHCIVIGGEGNSLKEDTKHRKEKAAMICRAVNAHQPMVEALEEALKAVDEAYKETLYFKVAKTSHERLAIEAALALAKGVANAK